MPATSECGSAELKKIQEFRSFSPKSLYDVVDCKPGQIMAQFFATRGY